MSQAAIGRALGIAASTVTKHKLAGMPVDSLEAARAWYKTHTNIAQRKPASRLAEQAHVAALSALVPGGLVQQPSQALAVDAGEHLAEAGHGRMGGGFFDGEDRAAERRLDSGMGEGFDSARTREKIAAANLAEMEEAALRGTYLVKDDFERHLFNAGRMLRDTLTNCARRIGAEVSGLATAEECEAVIDREHRAALASFAQALRHTLKIEVESSQPGALTGLDSTLAAAHP